MKNIPRGLHKDAAVTLSHCIFASISPIARASRDADSYYSVSKHTGQGTSPCWLARMTWESNWGTLKEKTSGVWRSWPCEMRSTRMLYWFNVTHQNYPLWWLELLSSEARSPDNNWTRFLGEDGDRTEIIVLFSLAYSCIFQDFLKTPFESCRFSISHLLNEGTLLLKIRNLGPPKNIL